MNQASAPHRCTYYRLSICLTACLRICLSLPLSVRILPNSAFLRQFTGPLARLPKEGVSVVPLLVHSKCHRCTDIQLP